jgi:predicted nucleotidyltransferase
LLLKSKTLTSGIALVLWKIAMHEGKSYMVNWLRGVEIDMVIKGMVQDLCEELGEQLVSVAVYGSHARGTATPRSDIDLLVVMEGLSRDWGSIHRLEDEWVRKGRRLGKRFQVMLASPEDVKDSVEWVAPLMLEIFNNHKIVFDRDDFFRSCIIRMGALVKERGIRMRRPGVWEVPEHAVSP